MPTWRMGLKDKSCWLCGDFSACWYGKVGIEVGCFIVGTCMAPWSVMVGLGRLFAATVSTMPGHHARPPARHWLRQWQRYRRCYEWLRMTLTGRVIRECRMQFPRHCVAPRFHIVGIATFVDAVESSFNRIACETASRMCACTHVGPILGAWARYLARGPGGMRVGGAQAHI